MPSLPDTFIELADLPDTSGSFQTFFVMSTMLKMDPGHSYCIYILCYSNSKDTITIHSLNVGLFSITINTKGENLDTSVFYMNMCNVWTVDGKNLL